MPDGAICYLEIPALDVVRSSQFYAAAFGWEIRVRGNGERAFNDSTGAVSGSWATSRAPALEPGILPYVMVDSIEAAVAKVTAAGGEIVQARTELGPGGEACATFADPAGNIVGLYQLPRQP